MNKKAVKAGKELERRVADAYRQMGARKVEHDVELAGHQIDRLRRDGNRRPCPAPHRLARKLVVRERNALVLN